MSKSGSIRADVAAQTLAEGASAHQNGDLATARRLYRKVLKLQPRNFRALRLSGLAAFESGRSDEALQLLGAAVRHAPPHDSGALEDLALVHLQRAEQEKAEHLLRRALEIKPDSLAALTRLGSALITSGQGAEAVEIFRRARDIKSDDPHIHYSHAHALLESGRFEEAVAAADEALAINADDGASLTVKGVALLQLERFQDAEAALARCVAVAPEDINGWMHLGRARMRLEDSAGALQAFREAAKLAPDAAPVQSQLANAYTTFGEPAHAVEVCDQYLARHPASAALLVVKLLALRDAGRTAEADELAGLDRLIVKSEIAPPAGYRSVEEFNAALALMVRRHPDLQRTHTNRATRHGVQTGSLTFNPPPEMRAFFAVIDREVHAAQARLREEGCATHPWVEYAPSRWKVNAWAVLLEDGGHQLSHIHPQAWMSGCYYVAVPEDGMGAGHGEDGWIEFGRPSDQLFTKTEPPVVAVEPRPGRMVMFPSYTFHRTIPFHGQGQRICIAFDVFTD
jgi:Flp pilus assembly protein TadD